MSDLYIKYLLKEINLRKNHELVLDTIYFGGGSPSLLTAAQLAAIMEAATINYNLGNNTEITLEANPEDLSAPQLREFHRAGINRLSIGVQSFQKHDLRCLKRSHNAAQAEHAVDLALDAGFTNFSLDLIIGLESQTDKSMTLNFHTIEKLKPSHISVYILEGVPRIENDDHDARLYFQSRKSLLAIGYQHYEVSNYCRPGKASRHNLKYWQNQPYIGLGASAAGYLNGCDYKNFSDLKKYYTALGKGILPEQKIPPLQPDLRRVITGLRLLDGIPASAFKPFSIPTDFLLSESLLIRRGANLSVPPKKILLLNEILGYFI